MKPVNFAVVGVRNFAGTHIRNIGILEEEGVAKLAAVVIANQDRNAEAAAELRERGVKVFGSFAQLLAEGHEMVDIITLPTTIPSHFGLARQAMQAGYNVVMEKPPVPTIQQLEALKAVEVETGQFCSVGFQFIHSVTIRRLKEMLVSGKLGTIKDIACKGYWPRDVDYYTRNGWAGKSIWEGQLVLDGPMHNALAHYLNNMLFLAGPEMDRSVDLKTVRAELYRSRENISSDDTTCFHGIGTNGTEIFFYVTHSPADTVNPYMEIRCSEGTVQWHMDETTVVTMSNGEEIRFDNDGVSPWVEVMRTAARVHNGELPSLYCTLDNVRAFVTAINGSYVSARQIVPIPAEYLEHLGEGGQARVVVKDLMENMDKAFAERKLLSDIGVPWAVATRPVSTEGMTAFDPFAPFEEA